MVRQFLFFMVISSVYYLIVEPFASEVIKNISYSLIATFIFDTGLNFSKENITKGIISQKWHNDLYSSFERMKSLGEIYLNHEFTNQNSELSKKIISSMFELNLHAKKDISLMWNLSSDKYLSYQEIVIKKGENLNIAFLKFIEDDCVFFDKLRMDAEVFKFYPSIMKPTFNGARVLSNFLNTMKDPSRFRATKESLEKDLADYLELRFYLLQDIEEVMGHYTQRGP